MKGLAGIIGCWWVLAVLFTAELCRADVVFLASAGNILAISDVNESSAVSNLDGAGNANALHGQKQGGVNYSPKSSAENKGLVYADISESPMERAGAAGNSRGISENSGSPFEHYLLIAIAGGTVGLVLIAAGIAQWWWRRSIRQYWLFPTVQDDGEPAEPGASSPPPLIAKKQMEMLPEEKIDKHAQRRAA